MVKLDNIQKILQSELSELNQIIHNSLQTDNELMNRIVTTYLQTKGKQIRPILVLLSAKMLGYINNHVLYAGAALEMLHNASLIHDDIVDETKIRRGTPTINATWDNHIAVLVGDFFVSNALAAGLKTNNISILAALSALGQELALGEIDQICNAQNHLLDEQKYFSVIRKKTASLFMDCVRMGAEAGNAPKEEIPPMIKYAELLGLCFQIKDDIFDYFNDDTIGKPTGNDLREGKITLPLIYALNHSTADDADAMRQLIKNDNLTESDITQLIEFAKREGGVDYAYECMREMQEEAEKIIFDYADSEAKEAFRKIFDFIIRRDK